MIDRIVVRNFQSLRQADLSLGRFTVIVGQTSSGKSALVRALRMVTSNARGSAFVSQGQRLSTVSLHVDGAVLTIERGEGHGRYRLAIPGQPEQVFTKLGGEVPEPVSRWLRLWPGERGALNIAAQFDPPFLLAEPGSAVARALGELTHVTVLLEAAREANRRRLAAAGTLKVRQADLASLVTQVQSYGAVTELATTLNQLDRRVEEARAVADRIDRLQDLIRRWSGSVVHRPPALPELPDVAAAYQRLRRLADLLDHWQQGHSALSGARTARLVAEQQEAAAHEALHALLVAAGQCPTCGQTWTETS